MSGVFVAGEDAPAMSVHSGFAPAQGTKLRYQVAGSGPPVVLLHAFSFDRRMWDDQMDALTRHHTVVRYDLRGFGESPPGSTPYTHADDLAAVMDDLGIERAALVGLSLGGGAAINFAITRPERVSALVAVAPSLGGIKWSEEFVAAHGAIRSAAQGRGIGAARELWLGGPIFAPALANPLSRGTVRAIVDDYSGWHWTRPDPGIPLNPPAIERLGSIRAPTLVVVGELDAADVHRIAAKLESGIPAARKVVIPGVGHMANLEEPRVFNRMLLEFLNANSAQGAIDEWHD